MLSWLRPTVLPASSLRHADIGIALALASVGAAICWTLSGLLDPSIFRDPANDFWFQADLSRVVSSATDLHGQHSRNRVHPLYTLVVYPGVALIRCAFGQTPLTAVFVFQSLVAAVWVASLLVVARLLGCSRRDAALVCAVGMASSAFVFWFPVPETYAIGSLCILGVVIFSIALSRRPMSVRDHVLIGLISLSMTVTNWMMGVLATAATQPMKRALRVFGTTLAVAVVLSVLQRLIFHGSGLFFLGSSDESRYLLPQRPGGVLGVFRVLLVDSVSLGHLQALASATPYWPTLSAQAGPPGSATPFGPIAVGCWVVLLAIGIVRLAHASGARALKAVVLGGLVGQLALHGMYGDESFLYALHLLPLMLTAVAYGLTTSKGAWIRLLAVGFVVFGGIHSLGAFQQVTLIIAERGTRRDDVARESARRPLDYWPRGGLHAVLAIPGSEVAEKAYVEPGGSFSPWAGSFGVSLAAVGSGGRIKSTSDTEPLEGVSHEFDSPLPAYRPSILTRAPHYEMNLRALDRAHLQLDVRLPRGKSLVGQSTWLLIRGVGPAAGPITSLRRTPHGFIINERWLVEGTDERSRYVMGDESKDGLRIVPSATSTERAFKKGWGYAAISLPDIETTIEFENISRPRSPSIDGTWKQGALVLDVPDRSFALSATAQVQHLLMGLIGDRTRPGDPIHCDQEWLRDGVYVIVALARSGYVDLAKRLAMEISRDGFSGRFGAEADAPGLVLWAIGEVDGIAADPSWRRAVWPYVLKKASRIQDCFDACASVPNKLSWPLFRKYAVPAEPDFVCGRSRDGLIVGRADLGRPMLSLTAVSYLGVTEAARIAEKLQELNYARRWLLTAQELRSAWQREFVTTRGAAVKRVVADLPRDLMALLLHAPSERSFNAFTNHLRGRLDGGRDAETYTTPLWPTNVAAGLQGPLTACLESRWAKSRQPDGSFTTWPTWTYFDLAETHQRLRLGDSGRVWSTLRWFWSNDPMRGLCTLWAGTGEGRGTRRLQWEEYRGLVFRPPAVIAPHYWSAAELLLLQLEMMAYVEDCGARPQLVIGQGIPTNWLAHAFAVRGIHTSQGRVDFSWDGDHTLVVSGPTTPTDVRLGAAFPKATSVRVRSVADGVTQ